MKTFLKKIRSLFPLSWKDCLILVLVMAAGSGICTLLQTISTSDVHVPMIFVLMVLIISMLTDGYFYGILAAVASVFAVNWAFTYPYMKLDFSVYGYPLTFITMLAVGIASSALATRLKEQQKLRLEAEREKTRANLLRSVSHDLRTPLTTISGSISAVLENGNTMEEEEKRELLVNAREDAQWLNRLVENLLSITRISGSSAIHKTDELLEEVISEAVVSFQKRNPDVKVSVSLPEEPLFVPMDAMLIEQVLRNLMENAVVHGQTTDRIQIAAVREGTHIAVSVADNGRGISQQMLPHLFDGMIPMEKKNSDGNRFMGIGLAVCRTIIEAHGGTISAANRKEGGAVFRFTLETGGNTRYEYSG
ncbi:MAG: DUF4118 domain-containing protein [Oscillospiraceae bacterium]|nr:DUF4118 domain-containing protein [Oscillospiraceae bacterium]